MTASKRSNRDHARRHREKMRAKGLRPVQIWVPDTRRPEYAAELKRQMALVSAAAVVDNEENRWLDALSDSQDLDGWEP